MKLQDVKKVGVVGAGTMGGTIAAAIATRYPIVVKEENKKLADKSLERIKGLLPALSARGVITEVEREVAASRISMTADFAPFKECQVIIEAVPDDLDLKIKMYSELNKVCSAETIFATTSSLVSIAALAAGSGRPDKMIGTHFCMPAHMMQLVEVAPCMQTSDETTAFMMEFLAKGIGKAPIKTKDRPGYIVNFMLFPFLIQAVKAFELGLGTPEEIDNAVKMGLGHRMGPFDVMDMSNMEDVSGFTKLYEQLNDPKFALPVTLKKMSEAGFWGQKVGKGFYLYDEKGKKVGPNPDILGK